MDIAALASGSLRLLVAPAALLTIGVATAACSSSAPSVDIHPSGHGSGAVSPRTAPATAPKSSPALAGSESAPPGDIPDNTAYIVYRAAASQYQVRVPEGWARTISGSGVSF